MDKDLLLSQSKWRDEPGHIKNLRRGGGEAGCTEKRNFAVKVAGNNQLLLLSSLAQLR